MRTDDDLTTLLRRGFTQATADLDPEPGLVHAVRRRYVRARWRRLVVGAAVPAAALAAGSGLTLAGRDVPNHTPSHTVVAVAPPSAPATSGSAPASVTSVPIKPASYKLVALNDQSAPPNCRANAPTPFGKSGNPAGAWFWIEKGTCVFVGVGWAHTRPMNAAPVHINGYPGLYGTLENKMRTIYAPVAPGAIDAHPRGGWLVLMVSANAPEELVVRLIAPAN